MKKLGNKKGFTLVEVLLAVAILAFLSALASVSTSSILATSRNMRMASKAQILGSEVVNFVSKEMRFSEGHTFDADGRLEHYNSVAYGVNCSIYIDEDGKLTVKSDAITAGYSPIGNTLYDQVGITLFECTKTDKEGMIAIKVEISSGADVLYSFNTTLNVLNAL